MTSGIPSLWRAALACALLWAGLTWAATAHAQSFTASLGKTQIYNNGQDLQTLTLTLTNAPQIDQVRWMINYPAHTENGLGTAGYFQVTATACAELSPQSYGNPLVTLQTGTCARTQAPNGDVTFTAAFAAEPGFVLGSNHQVSAIWYAGGVAQTGWKKLTATGAGFAVTAAPPAAPASFRSFSFDEPSVLADGADLQTLRITLNDAATVTDLRLLINRSGQAENGRTNDGYLQWTPGAGCAELGGGTGNDKITLQTAQCAVTTAQDGSRQYVFPLAFLSTFGAAQNNHVSAIWYVNGVAQTSWRKVTNNGAGFDVEAGAPPAGPPTFGAFSFDKTTLQADGADVQTLRITLNSAANVSDLRLLINRPGQADNGRSYDGYFQWTPGAGCAELGASLGNDKVNLLTAQCQTISRTGGAIEYTFPFQALPTFGEAQNNQVSAIWYENGVLQTSWRRVTTAGAGFAVVGGSASPSYASFSFDQPSIQANGAQTQTLRLRLNGAATVDDVRILINRPGQAENGRSYDGYFQWTPSACAELGGGLGNDKVTLNAAACVATALSGGVTEYAFPFAAEPSFGAAANNQVSAIWYAGGVALTGWRKVTDAGAGFAVTQATSLIRNACGGFGLLTAQPGAPCGQGNLERQICDGANAVRCDAGDTFSKLSAGREQVCGIRSSDSTLRCWGRNDFNEATPPTGTFSDVDAGYDFTCGVRTTGALACWGAAQGVGLTSPPSGTYTQVSAGALHACAIRASDKAAVCWGSNLNGETNAPAGQFLALSAGDGHTCALKTDKTLQCWGLNNLGEASPPAGTWKAVSAGTNVSCAIRDSDGRASCWGINSLQQASPPQNQTFATLSVGLFYGCGVTTAGQAVCWGTGGDGQTTPAAGTWADTTQALLFACGRRADGSARCWGKLAEPATTAPRSGLCGGDSDPTPTPGAACGRCGLDINYCASTSTTACSGDSPANACGGCLTLDDEPDDACGRCGLDRFACDGAEDTTCDGDTPANACGGCGPLPQVPGDVCGANGQITCDGAETTRCSATDNTCGGDNHLLSDPGQSCQFNAQSGFLFCYNERALTCSAGFDTLTGDRPVSATLTSGVAGELFAADVNGDGNPDLLSGTRAYLGPFSSGTAAASTWPRLNAFGRIEPVGDLNNDGDTDFLIGNRDIVYGPATNSAALQTPDAQVNGFTSRALGHGDLNNDGNDDLVLFNANGAYVFFGPILGSLGTSGADVQWLTTLETAALADLNHDGRADLVVQRCDLGAAQSGGRDVTLARVLLGPPTTTVALSSGLQIKGFEPDGVSYEHGCPTLAPAGDTDGDGRHEVALAQPDHATPTSLAARVTLLEGPFTATVNLNRPESPPPAGVRFLTPSSTTDSVRGQVWAAGDLDADGLDDLAFQGFDYTWLSPGARIPGAPFSAAGADFNGDGFSDLALEGASNITFSFGAP
jgi:hypothetical protein